MLRRRTSRRARRFVLPAMPTPRRRLPLATGAFFLAALLASGCATAGKRFPSVLKSSSRGEAAPILTAPRLEELGRVHSYDAADATAVIEFTPRFVPPAGLAGRLLVARNLDTLEPTAKLAAAPYQSGRLLGAYVLSGAPGVGDEVVLDPEPFPTLPEPSRAPAAASKPAAP